MKNPNQANGKAPKGAAAKPAQKTSSDSGTKRPRSIAPLPIAPRRPSATAVLAGDPLANRKGVEFTLDWIGNSMEPEVQEGDLALINKREDMRPCLCELVVGLLKSGELVFGAFNARIEDGEGFFHLGFINPDFPSVIYREDDFAWLYPVEFISTMDPTGTYRRITKHIEFERGDD